MVQTYELREPVQGQTLLQVTGSAAKELNLAFDSYRPVGEPRSSKKRGVLIEKRFEQTGWKGLLLRLFPKTQFSFTAFLHLDEQISQLEFMLFNGFPLEFDVGGQKNTLIETSHPNYGAVRSLLDTYMGIVYGKLNELRNQARQQ